MLSFAVAAPAVDVDLVLSVVVRAPAVDVDLLLPVVVAAPAVDVDLLLSVVVAAVHFLLPDVVVDVVVVSPAIGVCSLTDTGTDGLSSLSVDIASDRASDSVCVGSGSGVGGSEPVIFIQISLVDGTEKQGLSIPVKNTVTYIIHVHVNSLFRT